MTQQNMKMGLECLSLDSSGVANRFDITDEKAVAAIKDLIRQLKQTALNETEFIPVAIERLNELWDDAAVCWKPFIESAYFELTSSINGPRNLAEKKIAEGLLDRPVKKIKKEKRDAPEIDLTSIFSKKKLKSDGIGVNASPAALKLATELGIDIATVPVSGANGKITKSDVEAEAERLTSEAVL